MSDLIQRVSCPIGCKNSIITETVKVISKKANNLLVETSTSPSVRIKVYTCQCCGNTFEMAQHPGKKVL